MIVSEYVKTQKLHFKLKQMYYNYALNNKNMVNLMHINKLINFLLFIVDF